MLSCMIIKSKTLTARITEINHFMNSIASDTSMANMLNVRWAFNAKAWTPTREEILTASSLIQTEEKERISRYVFQEDAKSSLIGRLLIRKFIHLSTSIPYKEIELGRDGHGKPYLINTGEVNFNVSHQGDFVVLAGNTKKNIGIDVMKIEPPANKNIPEFFRLMARQFSPQEWTTVHSFPNEMEQIACFYRIWCLKESYVKNIGLGITIPLQQISFLLKTMKLKVGEIVTDTQLYEEGVLKEQWTFEETMLDEKHCVAVSVQEKDDDPTPYQFLIFEDLVKDAKPLVDCDRGFEEHFIKKKLKDL